jgi:hypothetical protein
MGSIVLGSLLSGGGGGVSVEPGPAQIIPPVARVAAKQAPQLPGVQAQQAPVVNTGAAAQTPIQLPDDREKKLEEMVALLVKQGLSEQQIKERVDELNKQNFFDTPQPTSPDAAPASFKGKPVGLLASEEEKNKQEEDRPRGILGI